jgi:hypothetical protein
MSNVSGTAAGACALLGFFAGSAVAGPPAAQSGGPQPKAALVATVAAASSSAATISALSRTAAEWRALFAVIPPLAGVAAEFAFLPAKATTEALERGGRTRETASTWTFVDRAFEWRPNAQRTLWIVSGAAGGRVVLAVLEPGAEPKHLASSVLLESDPALAIGYSASEPNRLLWTTCYGCPGLGGSIELGANGKVVISYR